MSKPHRSEMLLKTGHAPGHLRECLLNALLDHGDNWFNNLEMDFLRERHQRWWDGASPNSRALWLLGQLWNCTDIVGSLTRSAVKDWLDEETEHFTFASLARALKKDLDARAIVPEPQTPNVIVVQHEKLRSEPREVLVEHQRPPQRVLTIPVGRREP